ncbi:Arylacetamide deacetylase [Handroanthus impetiginosus]|uniref:Arylacetamide deacetylase n=1 Tax=Handroanthus impetiginosus TaxID=429701 RepID=A0A2G9HSE6_9LAMI|nr:Arylacetamide deacetylase [Handroanthus impetiginosus]
MNPETAQVTHDFPSLFRVYDNGQIARYQEHDFVPPSLDPKTGVESRDVVISPENNVSARIYLPKTAGGGGKLPLIIYIHGGAFSIQSAFSSLYHYYINELASESGSIVVSIEYRLAPEHPIPACYDDSYAAIKWVDSHAGAGQGPDPWLNECADFERVYVAGDSAGATISHNMVIRGGFGFKFSGLILIHPFFGIGEPNKLWDFICPDTIGPQDLRLNPTAHLDHLSKLGCERVLVCVAGKDSLRERGWNYYQKLKNTDWEGVVEFFETHGEDHVFHLFDRECENSISLMKRIVSFIKG